MGFLSLTQPCIIPGMVMADYTFLPGKEPRALCMTFCSNYIDWTFLKVHFYAIEYSRTILTRCVYIIQLEIFFFELQDIQKCSFNQNIFGGLPDIFLLWISNFTQQLNKTQPVQFQCFEYTEIYFIAHRMVHHDECSTFTWTKMYSAEFYKCQIIWLTVLLRSLHLY